VKFLVSDPSLDKAARLQTHGLFQPLLAQRLERSRTCHAFPHRHAGAKTGEFSLKSPSGPLPLQMDLTEHLNVICMSTAILRSGRFDGAKSWGCTIVDSWTGWSSCVCKTRAESRERAAQRCGIGSFHDTTRNCQTCSVVLFYRTHGAEKIRPRLVRQRFYNAGYSNSLTAVGDGVEFV
jgi:hypothetical protein